MAEKQNEVPQSGPETGNTGADPVGMTRDGLVQALRGLAASDREWAKRHMKGRPEPDWKALIQQVAEEAAE